MIFVKKQVSDDISTNIEVYDDEFYSVCPMCGKEERVELETLAEIIDRHGSITGELMCSECSKKEL